MRIISKFFPKKNCYLQNPVISQKRNFTLRVSFEHY